MAITPSIPPVSPALTRRVFSRRSFLPLSQEYLWQIEVGVVRTLTWLEDGTAISFGLWGPGDLVGRVLSKAEPYKIECLTDVEVSILPRARWYQATESMLLHTQRLGEFMEIVHTKPIEISVLRLMTWLAQRFGREIEQGQLIDLRLTHQEIAEMIGSSRVTVTRVLNEFEKQGVIQRLHRKLVIPNEQQPFWHYEI